MFMTTTNRAIGSKKINTPCILMSVAVSFVCAPTVMPQESIPVIQIKVVDDAGKPIAGAAIRKSHVWKKSTDQKIPNIDNLYYECDAQGVAAWELPGNTESLRVWARADGFVPLALGWESEEIRAGEKLPSVYVFKLPKGTEIGGTVVDALGKPIQGVQVSVACESEIRFDGRARLQGLLAYGESLDGDGQAATTNENGRWSINNAPEDPKAKFRIHLTHPDYISDKDIYKVAQFSNSQALRDMSARFVMRQGGVIKGRLHDEDGNPPESGIVVFGEDPSRSRNQRPVMLEEDGRFTLPQQPAGEIRLTFIVPGFAPQTQMIDVKPMMDDLEIEMQPGKSLKILVVDANEKPVPGAAVQLRSWRGTSALYNMPHPDLVNSRIPIFADDKGLFEWNWAPEDNLTLDIGQMGYLQNESIELAASDTIHIVKLTRRPTVRGNVFNKSTGEKIPNFNVEAYSIVEVGDNEVSKSLGGQDVSVNNGRFRVELGMFSDDAEKEFELVFSAMDFKSFRSERFKPGTNSDRLKIELEPQPWPTATVLDVEGQPLAGCEVRIATKNQRVNLNGYRSGNWYSDTSFKTDESGAFKYQPIEIPSTFVVVDQMGYCEAKVDPGTELKSIRLEPWANLCGRLFDVDGKPIANQEIIFEANRFAEAGDYSIQGISIATTDAEGYFEFVRLPGMPGMIRNSPNHPDKETANEIGIPVRLTPGKSSTLDIGKGVKVFGTIQSVEEPAEGVDASARSLQIVKIGEPEFGLPDGVAELNEMDWNGGWSVYLERLQNNRFKLSPRIYMHAMRSYSLALNEDGSFAIGIDQPGEYEFHFTHVVGNKIVGPRTIGQRAFRFTIDDTHIASGELDLGNITVEAVADE